MEEVAFAKLNLALHVRDRLPDNYHRIETIFAFVEAGDRLSAAASDTLSLTASGPFAASLSTGSDNLVLRAASALQCRYDVSKGAALHLEKILPVAAGIGGGAADAAATLRLLTRLWELPTRGGTLATIAEELGADVPACLASRPAWGEGKGESLVPADGSSIAGLPVLLVNPGVELPTGPVFAAWEGEDRGPLVRGPLFNAALSGRNDLEMPASRIVPEISAVIDVLRSVEGAQLVRMSGSGATCFAVFGEERDRDLAAERLSGEHPGWWHLATRLRD